MFSELCEAFSAHKNAAHMSWAHQATDTSTGMMHSVSSVGLTLVATVMRRRWLLLELITAHRNRTCGTNSYKCEKRYNNVDEIYVLNLHMCC